MKGGRFPNQIELQDVLYFILVIGCIIFYSWVAVSALRALFGNFFETQCIYTFSRHSVYTQCLKKVLTFELSVTLSNLNRFSKFLHCWKTYEICYKTDRTKPTSP